MLYYHSSVGSHSKVSMSKAFSLLTSSTALSNIPQSLCTNRKHVQMSEPSAQSSNTAYSPEVLVDAIWFGSRELAHHKKHSILSSATAWLHHPVQTRMEKRDADANMPGLLGSEQLRTNAHIAHGTVMSVAIVLFFPLGGMIMKLFKFPRLVWIHAAVQMVGMLILITGFALGIWLSILHNEVSLVSVCCLRWLPTWYLWSMLCHFSLLKMTSRKLLMFT